MFAWLTVAALAFAGALLCRLPARLVRGYTATFPLRHGVGVQLGTTILATVVLAMLVTTLFDPGRRPVMELVDGAVVLLGLAVAALDLYLFERLHRDRLR
jgi:hypothetical protein